MVSSKACFDRFTFQGHRVSQTRPPADDAGQRLIHRSRERPETRPVRAVNEAVQRELQVRQAHRDAVVWCTPQRRGAQALFHGGDGIVPSAFDRGRGPTLQRTKEGSRRPKLIVKVELGIERNTGCMLPHKQSIMAVHHASADRQVGTL